MSGRAITILVAVTAAVLLLCITVPAALFSATAACLPAAASPSASVDRWSQEQVDNARTIINVGARMRVPPRGWVIAVAVAMQESSLINRPDGDRDSVGLFQQRPSQGWGTRNQLTDPEYAAGKFYQKLLSVDGWQDMPLAEAAQAVQNSVDGGLYAKREKPARELVAALAGQSADCDVPVGPQGWVAPVKAPIVSGFRTADRPGHDGVDLGAARGTPIHAASAGTVLIAACNVTAGTCDQPGSPRIGGCGWYVDLKHAQGVITRYCHMLTRPYVNAGQTVAAGQVIGQVGSSGNSSGPHLHYETHVRREALNNQTEVYEPVDPVAFHAQVEAPLGAA